MALYILPLGDWNALNGRWLFYASIRSAFPLHYAILGPCVPWTWIPWLFSMAPFVVNNFLTFLAQVAHAQSLSMEGDIQKGLSGIWAQLLGLPLFLRLFSGLK